jgi:hypothetical protein
MHASAQALLDAHTRHILSQLSGDSLTALLNEETASSWEWLATRPVTAIADEVRVRDFLLRNVFEITPTERLLSQIGRLVTRVLQSPLNKTTKLEELLNGREYDLIVDRLVELEDLRRELLHAAMQNPSVAQLISDLLYNGVKNYLSDDGGLAKKVPGMSSLMKMGKGVMASVGADEAVENAIRSYLKRNTRMIIEMSERVIAHSLETPKLKAISRQFWQNIKGMPLERATRYVKEDDVEDFVAIGATIWNHFRQTTYARELLNELVHAWFEKWGNEPAVSVLESLSLDQARLKNEVHSLLSPLVAELISSGHLELRLRHHLASFYGSSEVEALLNA